MGWKMPQVNIISALTHKMDNAFLINETEAINIFLSNKFNNYPAYLFGTDLLESIRDSLDENKLQEMSSLVLDLELNLKNLKDQRNNHFEQDIESDLVHFEMAADFLRSELEATGSKVVNYNIGSISTKETKLNYLLYVLLSFILGLISALIVVFFRNVIITDLNN